MTFHVGQKVVCIKEPSPVFWASCRRPSVRNVYTVRAMEDEDNSIWLCEISNEIVLCRYITTGRVEIIEPSFPADHFRPVVERKTDISIFTAMLNPSKQGVEA